MPYLMYIWSDFMHGYVSSGSRPRLPASRYLPPALDWSDFVRHGYVNSGSHPGLPASRYLPSAWEIQSIRFLMILRLGPD
jgi:hypothetical protein